MVVAPKTLLAQWQKELNVCGLGRQAYDYSGTQCERYNYYYFVFKNSVKLGWKRQESTFIQVGNQDYQVSDTL